MQYCNQNVCTGLCKQKYGKSVLALLSSKSPEIFCSFELEPLKAVVGRVQADASHALHVMCVLQLQHLLLMQV